MTETQFWALIEPGKDDRKPQERLRRELEACKPDEIVSFQEHFDRHFEVAYAWDLWGAAYLIEGGCSDDGFTDFRSLWIDEYYRQLFAPMAGYGAAVPRGYNGGVGLRWDHVPGTGFLEFSAGWQTDQVSPAYDLSLIHI